MLVLQLVLLVIIINNIICINTDDDDVVFHTLAPTPSKQYTLSPTPHGLSNSTPDPTPAPTKNDNAPTRAPTDPPDETNGIIVVSTVFGCFLLGVLYFQYIKPNFISKKKLELAGRGNNISASDDAKAPEEADFGQIYGNQQDMKTTIIHSNSKESLSSNKKETRSSNQSFDEKDPLLPRR